MPLGLESGKILRDQITASSFADCCPVHFARLNFNGRWHATLDDTYKWIKIDLNNIYTVTGIVIQGWINWVTSCRIKYEEMSGSGALVYIIKEKNEQVDVKPKLTLVDVPYTRHHEGVL